MPHRRPRWWNIATWTVLAGDAALVLHGLTRFGSNQDIARKTYHEDVLAAGEIVAAANRQGWLFLTATLVLSIAATAWVSLAPRFHDVVPPIARWALLSQAPAALLLVAGVWLVLPRGDVPALGGDPNSSFEVLNVQAAAQVGLAAVALAAMWHLRHQAAGDPGDPLWFRSRLRVRRILVLCAVAGYLLLTAWLFIVLTLGSLFMGFVAAPLALVGIVGVLPLLIGLNSAGDAIDPETGAITQSAMDRATVQFVVATVVLAAGLIPTLLWPPVAMVLWPIQVLLLVFAIGQIVSLQRFRAAARDTAPDDTRAAFVDSGR